jgi:putative solute:sodium symporter small subunit
MEANLPQRIEPRTLEAYWKRTLRLTVILLALWLLVGYGIAIFMAPTLNQLTFLGGPLGFWFAQNGAIYIFWVLILIYAVGMNRIDKAHGVEETE